MYLCTSRRQLSTKTVEMSLLRDLEADSELKNNGSDEVKSEIIHFEVNDDAVSSKVEVKMPNDGIKCYSCDKCEYWSKYKQHLQRHTLSIYDGVT